MEKEMSIENTRRFCAQNEMKKPPGMNKCSNPWEVEYVKA
jgi:hypothetical protein